MKDIMNQVPGRKKCI